MYLIRCLWCYLRHADHVYSDWTYSMGPNGYYIRYRVCYRCEWIQLSE